MNPIVLILLFLCHFLADFTHLSTKWMLDAKRFGKPYPPILAHASVHSILMFMMLWMFFPSIGILKLFGVSLLQLVTHFVIDVGKGRLNEKFPLIQSPANKWHWVVFGADQYLHALVIILMAWLI